MKVFVAAESEGKEDDFAWTVPGELVHMPPLSCCDPECGCGRAMCGFVSRRATTCFLVRNIDIDMATYVELMFQTLKDGGWIQAASEEDRRWVEEFADEHIELAADLPVERVLGIRSQRVVIR